MAKTPNRPAKKATKGKKPAAKAKKAKKPVAKAKKVKKPVAKAKKVKKPAAKAKKVAKKPAAKAKKVAKNPVGKTRAKKPAARPKPAPPSAAEVREFVGYLVAGGFEPPAQVVESTLGYFELDESRAAEVDRMTQELIAAQRADEPTWPTPTDCERLDAAFADLEASGVVARQGFTCCQNCGHAEIGAEIEEARTRGPVGGYVFYHQQDTESAVCGDGLMLAYSALTDDSKATAEIGARVVEALRKAGLEPEWDGDITTRIFVPMLWRRRWPFAVK